MRIECLAVGALLLAGCSQTAAPSFYWAKMDTGAVRTSAAQEQADLYRAQLICNGRTAELDAVAPRPHTTSSVSPFEYPDPLAQSMTDFGNATSDFANTVRRSRNIKTAYAGCMAEFGYQAVPL